MPIGVGLPNTIPGTPGPRFVEWARTAEEMGCSTLATIGRLVFPTYEELQAPTAAAAVTDRIGRSATSPFGPVYDRALLAKLAAGPDQISEGRFVLGLATGWREEDFVVAGKEHKGRRDRLDADIEYMHRAVAAYEAAGSDELIFDPVSSDLRQLELLAQALGDRLSV